jgi:hypothetical protein
MNPRFYSCGSGTVDFVFLDSDDCRHLCYRFASEEIYPTEARG